MNKKTKKTIGWVIYVVVLVALVLGVPKGLAYILDTEYPMASITSGSMWPTLKKGDLVLIKGIDGKDELKVGDIVVYRNPLKNSEQIQSFTIHRIEKMRKNNLITKGDANNVSDNPVKYEDVIGKALTIKNKVVRIPYLGGAGVLLQKLYAK